jgi:hypothetical protein
VDQKELGAGSVQGRRQRFGEIPEGAEARIQAAEASLLDTWFDRALAASSLDDVLAGA